MTYPATPGGHSPVGIDQARLDRNWRVINMTIDAPAPSRFERALGRVGFPSRLTRIMGATPALRRAWMAATAVAVLVSLSLTDAARPRETLIGLLVLAPLAPVLGVALAYGPAADPAHEMTMATPTSGLRLVLWRTAVVLGISIGAFGLGSLLAPARSLMAAAWLLPSFALTAFCLALLTVTTSRRAAAITAVGWVVSVLIIRNTASDPLAAFGAAGQAVAFIVLLVAAGLVALRRDRFEVLGRAT